ncbi:hypothetical protein HPP92_010699 [Vanilla planifolia]|uniref:Uncharacterized protein n=1 Tax=Vanilla planifolia TaxID=51239 RepID=A0A835QUE2_VANPL|nr:hypothetical protein HPP92_010699 [Vanilla planifolia]
MGGVDLSKKRRLGFAYKLARTDYGLKKGFFARLSPGFLHLLRSDSHLLAPILTSDSSLRPIPSNDPPGRRFPSAFSFYPSTGLACPLQGSLGDLWFDSSDGRL